MTATASWCAAYIGIPWVAEGRDRDGCDCWGLVRLVLLERFGVAVPEYEGWTWTREGRAVLHEKFEIEKQQWTEVADEQPGDVLLFRMAGFATHVGIVVEDGIMLHCQEGRLTCLERYRRPGWERRRIGAYRPPGLSASPSPMK